MSDLTNRQCPTCSAHLIDIEGAREQFACGSVNARGFQQSWACGEIARLMAENLLLRERLTHHAVMPEYDCPGDTPEICSFLCHECGQEGCMASEIVRDANCALTPEVNRES